MWTNWYGIYEIMIIVDEYALEQVNIYNVSKDVLYLYFGVHGIRCLVADILHRYIILLKCLRLFSCD